MKGKTTSFVFIMLNFVLPILVETRKDLVETTPITDTMKRTWQCKVFGTPTNGFDPIGYYFVFYYAMAFSCVMDEKRCIYKKIFRGCDPERKCIDLYLTDVKCKCNSDEVGNFCRAKRPSNYVDRSEGWVMFLQHTYHWKSHIRVTVVIVAQIEKNLELPITVRVFDSQGGNVVFSKYTEIVYKYENPHWCWSSTTLEYYCGRFELIFNTKYSEGHDVSKKVVYVIQETFPFMDHNDAFEGDSETYTVYSGEYDTGYLSRVNTEVLVGTITAPFLIRNPSENIILYKRMAETWLNYSFVDYDCVPKIRIKELHNMAADRIKVYASMPLTVNIHYSPPRIWKGCVKGSIKEWRVWKLRYNKHYFEEDDVVMRGCCMLYIREYTFNEPALYYITFHTEHFDSKGTILHNYKGSWYEVLVHQLFIYMESEKFVNREDVNKIHVEVYDGNLNELERRKGIEYTWSCKMKDTGEEYPEANKYFNKDSPFVTFPKNTFKEDSVYNITVLARKPSVPAYLPVTKHMYLVVGTGKPDIFTLTCGCLEHTMLPGEVNYIFVKGIDGENLLKRSATYQWEYTEVSNNLNWKSALDLKDLEHPTSNFTFRMKKNCLEYEKTYMFKASVPNSPVFATITVTTPNPPPGFNCDPYYPMFRPLDEDRQGVAEYRLFCKSILPSVSLHYELYDNDVKSELYFNGRMLGYSNDGGFRYISTRGLMTVVLYDSYRMVSKADFSLFRLRPFNGSIAVLENYLQRSQYLVNHNQYDSAAPLLSLVTDLLRKEMGPKHENLRDPILTLQKIPQTGHLATTKMVLSTLRNVLETTVSRFDIYKTDSDLTKAASDVLFSITNQIFKIQDRMREEFLAPYVFPEILKAILDCGELILKQRNPETEATPEEYIKPFVLNMISQTSHILVNVFELVGFSVSKNQWLGDTQTDVTSTDGKICASAVVMTLQDLPTWSKTSTAISISSDVTESVGKPTDEASVQYVTLNTDPFWWAGGNIVTDVLLFSFCKRTKSVKCQKLNTFKHPVSLHLKITNPLNPITPVSGITNQLDPDTMTEEELDLGVTVYRFHLPKRAKLFLTFLFNGSEQYRVLFKEDQRPSYTMMEQAVSINAESPKYDLEYDNESDGYDKMYYMGILPGRNVPPKHAIPFRLKAYYVLCKTWISMYYAAFGCWVGNKTSETSVQCDCKHLSQIAATLDVPEYNLQPVLDYLLFLTPWENIVPLLILLVLLLLYLLLLVWAVIMGIKDRKKGNITVLEDNFPGEDYAYLLGVYTGSRFFSGTDSSVGVKLFGEADESRAHILTSSERDVFRTFSDDWFLMYTNTHLGKIERLLLWHDDAGRNGDWYVEKIEVYDIYMEIQYTFDIHDWIAIDVNKDPEISVTPLKVHEFFNMRKVFNHNLINGLKDTHLWTSVCLKHPRNPVSRVVRIHVLLCFTMVAFAVCLVLYLFYFGIDIDEDKPYYYLTTMDLLIFFLTFIAAFIIAYLIMIIFRRSFSHNLKLYVTPHIFKKGVSGNSKYSLYEEEDELCNINSKDVERYRTIRVTVSMHGLQKLNLESSPSHSRTCWENFLMVLNTVGRGTFLLPVKLPEAESGLIIRCCWFFTAWILCAVFIVTCVTVIMFFAWKLPTIKTKKYLSIFLGVVLFDALIISFMKIILFSAILSSMFQHLVPASSYRVDPELGKRKLLYGDRRFLKYLVRLRSSSIYQLMSSEKRNEKRRSRIRRHKCWLLTEFLMVTVLLVVISVIIHVYVINRFPTNYHATSMMSRGHVQYSLSFDQLDNRTEYIKFLKTSFVNQLYRFMWYNFKHLIDDPDSARKDWADDCIMRLLGNVRLRQLRVRQDACRINSYFNNRSMICASSWSKSSEDTADYSLEWQKHVNRSSKSSPWHYVSNKHSNESNFYGQSGTLYHGGGYIAELGFYRKQTRIILLTLEKQSWLDHFTRAVFITLTLYNVNTNLFTHVVFVAEHHPSGDFLTNLMVESVNVSISFDFWNISFIFFQVFFLLRILYYMNKLGVFDYISDVSNKLDVFLVVLGCVTVILYFVHIHISGGYVDEHIRRGKEEFFSFIEIIGYKYLLQSTMCFLLLCTVIKTLFSWRFGRTYIVFYHTLLLSWPWVVWLTPFYALFFAIWWRMVGYILNIFIFSHFDFIIIYYNNFNIMKGNEQIWSTGIFTYFICLITAFVVTLFMVMFLHSYKVAKHGTFFSNKNGQDINHAIFIRDEIVNLFRCRYKSKKKISAESSESKDEEQEYPSI